MDRHRSSLSDVIAAVMDPGSAFVVACAGTVKTSSTAGRREASSDDECRVHVDHGHGARRDRRSASSSALTGISIGWPGTQNMVTTKRS
jgi:hypothetical protein